MRKITLALDALSDTPGFGGFRGSIVLVAVSGGADSIALLSLLHRLRARYGYRLHAITVNHRIRSEAESAGDTQFVREFCARLEPPVPCAVKTLAFGEVSEVAASRGRGVEEAARYLRYRAYETVADGLSASWVMTGHTRNDRNETMLMRFFQGATGVSLAGLKPRRGRYLRPLLDVTHAELVEWLRESGISWREDATNSNDAYLRNRIRRRLVPILDEYIPGWDRGMRMGAEKGLLDEDLCRSLIRASWTRDGDGIRCSRAEFEAMHPAVRYRFLRDGLDTLRVAHRVSGGLLLRLSTARLKDRIRISGSGLCLEARGDWLFWGSDIVQNTKSGYGVYVHSTGCYQLPCGVVAVSGSGTSVFLDARLGPFSLPLLLRSRAGGDSVRAANGKTKTLKKLMNDWDIPDAKRNLVPLVEQDGEIKAIYGSLLGFPDWYVQI